MRVPTTQNLSYSDLLKEIASGNVDSIEMIPARREVIATINGEEFTVPTFVNDQTILEVS